MRTDAEAGVLTEKRRGPEIWLRGPVAARQSEWPPEPAHVSATPRRHSFVGVHGGAGTTTLATVYGGHDCGRDWPGPPDPRSVLLVARTHASGLSAAQRTLELFRQRGTPPGLDLDAVVLVADAPGRLPRPLAQRIKVIESVIGVHRVPWVADWRLGDLSGPPPRGTEALTRLTGAAGRSH